MYQWNAQFIGKKESVIYFTYFTYLFHLVNYLFVVVCYYLICFNYALYVI